MADIQPFRAIRPAEELTARAAALPYDVYNRAEAREAAKKDALSFLNIDRPETQFPEDQDMYASEVYAKAGEMLHSQIAEGIYRQDESDCFYVYELTMNGRVQTGLVACAAIDDYQNSIIKKHENTRAEKEEDRIRHVDACDAQTGPIFLSYRKNEQISGVISKVKQEKKPIFDFTSEDGIHHRGWCIADAADIHMIHDAFRDIDRIYIADGHHRAASAVKVGLKRREEHPGYTGSEPFNYFLSVLFADEELLIMDYNRVVKDLNGMSAEQFLSRLASVGMLEECDAAVRPERKGQVGIYLNNRWYRLTFRSELIPEDPVAGLDVSVLQKEVLSSILGIGDPRTDSRIDFVGGIRGLNELERRVHTDCAAAFSMYPTSIGELFSVADAGLLMPPKSTWFEPKLRSGLFIHSLT